MNTDFNIKMLLIVLQFTRLIFPELIQQQAFYRKPRDILHKLLICIATLLFCQGT